MEKARKCSLFNGASEISISRRKRVNGKHSKEHKKGYKGSSRKPAQLTIEFD